MPHDRMMATRTPTRWSHKYVFPGGMIPSIAAIEEQVGRAHPAADGGAAGLGPHYARRCGTWRRRFLGRWQEVAALGFDETFRRMWEFYLAYFEAGFRADYLNVWQLRMDKRQTS